MKAMVTRITTVYNHNEQESISECTTHHILRWMGYNSWRSQQFTLLPAKNNSLTLQWAQAHQYRMEKLKKYIFKGHSFSCYDVRCEYLLNLLHMILLIALMAYDKLIG